VTLVEASRLSVDFRVPARDLRTKSRRLCAVERVSLQIGAGETLALVGESGCGKTTLGRTLLRLHAPTEGRVLFDGVDIATLSGSDEHRFRRRVQMIFQDPFASLNPRMKVEEVIAEPLRAHAIGSRAERAARVRELLTLVGLPEHAANRFPHTFSGGQAPRIGIARALAAEPKFVVADEPVAALDVSIQAQVTNLLKELRERLGLTLLFISHDLGVVRQIATRVAVMYLGKLVEVGPRDAIFGDPRHPYTRSLLSAVPIPDPAVERTRRRIVLSGDVPNPITPPRGCRFHTRCPQAMAHCRSIEPELRSTADGRTVACHAVHPPADLPAAGA
jgi:oligopeptide transport system ATP-binding protein